MGAPAISLDVALRAVKAVGSGSTIGEAAELCGVSKRTVDRWVARHAVGMIKEHKPRPGSLTLDDRVVIAAGLAGGLSQAGIAAKIGCNRSTICRELGRNGGRDLYRPLVAEQRAGDQARRPKQGWTDQRPLLWKLVKHLLLTKQWSPQQISNRLKTCCDDPQWWVSHESIYQAIFIQTRGELRKELAKCLRSGRIKRRQRGRSSGERKTIAGMVNISERPAEVEDRAVVGHWEGDLIVGKNNQSAIATLVERTTRVGYLVKVDTKQADHVAQQLAEAVKRIPSLMIKSLTWDQGTEMGAHAKFSEATNIDVYFCDPRSPWQRPSNENFNGLVRQYFPKGTDLSIHSQDTLDEISTRLNDRPRKTLDWETPNERFSSLVALTK